MSTKPYLNSTDGIGDCKVSMFVSWNRERPGLTIQLIERTPMRTRFEGVFAWWIPAAHAVMDDFGNLVVVSGDGV